MGKYGSRTYTDTVAVLNEYELAPNTDLPDDALFGGGTMEQMDTWEREVETCAASVNEHRA
ncbi:MAG: hypothetical protein U0559_02320 [Anaerolineae bacterium]